MLRDTGEDDNAGIVSRYFRATMFAILVGAVVGTTAFGIRWGAEEGFIGVLAGATAALTMPVLTFFALFFACTAMIIWLPVTAILRALALTHTLHYALAGAITGGTFVYQFAGMPFSPFEPVQLAGTLGGLSGAIAFHRIIHAD